jgi:hypothetical protein
LSNKFVGATTTCTSQLTKAAATSILLIDLTRSGDKIVGLYKTTAGQPTGASDGFYSDAKEGPHSAIDYNTTTKYLNYGDYNGSNVVCINRECGRRTGYFITPSVSNTTVACALIFATGNDSPDRDPMIVTLEGSNATSDAILHLGSSWTLIYNGSTGMSPLVNDARSTYMIQQNFSNTQVFASYRLLIVSHRAPMVAVQYSEAHILGYT